MTPRKSSYPLLAQAETLLIYGIFLFLTGLAQICVTLSHRYLVERNIHKKNNINLLNLLPTGITRTDIHLWYIYPSAALTIVPFLCCVLYALFKRQGMTIVICVSSVISFICSSIYVGLLIVHTLEYWQTLLSSRWKSIRSSTTTTSSTRVLLPFDEQATFMNLALLITFTLALIQALLSLIGSVMSCLWSPCCMNSCSSYAAIPTNSHYVQTTPHRHETPQPSTIRSMKRQSHSETHRFLPTNGHHPDFLSKNSSIRSHYDAV